MKTRFSTIDLMAALHEVRGFTGLRVSNVSTFCFICLYCNFYHFYLFGILKFEIFQPYFLTNTLNYCSSKIKKIQIYDFSSLRGCLFWVIFILKTILISDLRFQSEGILDPTAKAGNQSDHSLGIGPASSPDRAKLGQVAVSLFVLDEAQKTRQGLTVDFVFDISHLFFIFQLHGLSADRRRPYRWSAIRGRREGRSRHFGTLWSVFKNFILFKALFVFSEETSFSAITNSWFWIFCDRELTRTMMSSSGLTKSRFLFNLNTSIFKENDQIGRKQSDFLFRIIIIFRSLNSLCKVYGFL